MTKPLWDRATCVPAPPLRECCGSAPHRAGQVIELFENVLVESCEARA